MTGRSVVLSDEQLKQRYGFQRMTEAGFSRFARCLQCGKTYVASSRVAMGRHQAQHYKQEINAPTARDMLDDAMDDGDEAC